MKVDLKREENNIVKLDIEIPAQDAITEYNKAVKKISQYANIPGFRKGKAPRNIVEKHVGVDTIKQEALDALLPNAFRTAIIENHLDVIAQPAIESFSFEVGEDVKITASVELRPEVTLGDYKGMTVDVEEFVTEKDAFDKSLQNCFNIDSFLPSIIIAINCPNGGIFALRRASISRRKNSSRFPAHIAARTG